IDEVLKDEQTLGRHYRCSAKVKQAHKTQPFVHGHHVSMEALLTLDDIVACTVVEGSMTKKLFLKWL
ncbi:hypothetical protein F4604DRAFT_1546035, partial [Suillus subluteus]